MLPGPVPLSELLQARLSPDRLSTYLAARAGNVDGALRLYEWNTVVTGALWQDLGHLEVLLRNALDGRMITRHGTRTRPGSWLDDPSGELHHRARQDIAVARSRNDQNLWMTGGAVPSR